MSIRFVTGDLFALPGQDAIGHGVNCEGVMGAGIAKEFRIRWPDMYTAYRSRCLGGDLRLGGLYPWQDPATGLWVYNIASQDRRGRNARLEALRSSLGLLIEHASKHQVWTVALPMIGAGIGGLDPQAVRDTFADVFSTPDAPSLTVVEFARSR